jgi:hypothetical protein
MPLHNPWLGSARKLLAEKIEQLHRTLLTLTDRVRQAIAQAIGKAVSGVVQETVRAVLDQLHGPLPDHRQLAYEPPRSNRFDHSGGLFPGGVPPDHFSEEEEEPPDELFHSDRFPTSPYRETPLEEPPLTEQEPARPPSRWRSWLALVLQALAWWLRRGIALPFLATVGVALTCLGGSHLLAAGVGAARSASDLLATVHNTSASAGALTGLLTS